MDTARVPVVLSPDEGEALWCVGALSTLKANAEQTGRAYSLIEDLAPQGAGTPLHRHMEDDEAFSVIDGELTFHLEEMGVLSGPRWRVRAHPWRRGPRLPGGL